VTSTSGGPRPQAFSSRYIERVITRDERVPLSDDDRAMENGWRCIPIPPTDDPRWFILDSSRDRKTVWGRWRDELPYEGTA
jgi:hypothetical protein